MNSPGRSGELRVALVGAGAISEVHLRALSSVKRARVVGIADLDKAAAERMAERYGVPSVCPDLSMLLEELGPGAVHILTPPPTHARLVVEALEAGAHVYVEKPMATTEAACRRMAEAARAAGRTLCVGHSMVRDPLYRRAAERLSGGELGELVLASFQLAYDPARHPGVAAGAHWSRSLPGGLLEDLAVHPASVLAALLGEIHEVERVPASDAGADPERTELVALLRGERALGQLTLSLRSRPADSLLEVRGTEGSLRLNYSNRTLTVERQGAVPPKLDRGLRNLRLATQLAVQTAGQTVRFALGRLDATGGVRTLIGEFYQALVAGTPAPVTPDEGMRVVRLLRSLWPDPRAAMPESHPAPETRP